MAKNLYQKILEVSQEVKTIEKNMTVSTGGNNSYKAVSDFDVVLAVKKAEAKVGVIAIPVKQELVDTQVVTSTDNYGKTRSTFLDIVKMTVRIIDCDNPSDFIEVESFGRGIDTGDKGFGKASTYARKYALLNAYKIATGEDPDSEASPENTTITQQNKNGGATDQPTIETALEAVKNAKNETELKKVWSKFKPQFGKNAEFVKAVQESPVNPKGGRSNG